MDYTTLGRTGLKVSVMGLGGGGPSQLGMRSATDEQQSIAVVRRALDLGVNLIDTAESYRTEEVIGRAVNDFGRDKVVLATKKTPWSGHWRDPGGVISEAELAEGLEASLRRLGTDHVDIYQLHALGTRHYGDAVAELVPAMQRLRDQGKLRFIGVTEEFIRDPGHEMLRLAVRDDCWDTVMVGYNLVNQSARERVFTLTRERGIGTLIMFAVRRALSQPAKLRELLADLAAQGRIDPRALDAGDPLGFATAPGVAATLPEAAYRFCRHTPGADVILSGTGDPEHVSANAAALGSTPLPAAVRERLERLFARVDNASGN